MSLAQTKQILISFQSPHHSRRTQINPIPYTKGTNQANKPTIARTNGHTRHTYDLASPLLSIWLIARNTEASKGIHTEKDPDPRDALNSNRGSQAKKLASFFCLLLLTDYPTLCHTALFILILISNTHISQPWSAHSQASPISNANQRILYG